MDTAARSAFEAFVRRIVCRDLDVLSVEIDLLRHELLAVRAAAGIPVEPPEGKRRQHVVRMREAGMSVRAIAAALDVHRATVTADLRVTGAAPPPEILGLDGRRTRPRHRLAG